MKGIISLLAKKQESVGSAAFVLATMVLTSRLLGLLRDRMLAARFAPEELGVYFAAFRIPNLIFELLVMGALTSAFIPVFTKYVTQGKEGEAQEMTLTILHVALVFLFFLSVPLLVFAPTISGWLAPGFTTAQITQMATFTRFMIIFQVAPLLVGNLFTGILQSYNIFLIPAAAPVIYNLGIIAGIFFLSPVAGLMAPVIGVGIGAFLFLLIQLPLLALLGFGYRWSWNLSHRGVKEVGKLMAPRTFGLAISQIDTTVDLMLASLLGARMVTIFNFAQHLQQVPVGLFGATVAQAALPMLSISSAKENLSEFKKTIIRSLHQILFFVLPTSVLFIVLRIPTVRLVFGASRFDWQATVATGMTLSAFAVSLFAQAMVQVLARAFYALYDSKTPVGVGVISILTNTTLSVMFILFLHWPVWALGVSASIASIFNALVLLYLLDRRVHSFAKYDLWVPPLKMTLAAVLMGLALYIPLKLLDQLVFDTTRTFGLILLTGVTGSIGLATYLFLSWVLGVSEVRSFFNLLARVRRRIIFEPAAEV
ncbi:murein biosynthesis integral membrane protein MurJ [Candidatus Gottesmanbacteria bacterium]|nr:murein biosynthesis integral membrane protein MurJ [Candidatus Gottesmanbacteria bacterium]